METMRKERENFPTWRMNSMIAIGTIHGQLASWSRSCSLDLLGGKVALGMFLPTNGIWCSTTSSTSDDEKEANDECEN